MNTTTGIREAWGRLWHRLAIAIPLKIIAWLDQEKRDAKHNHPLTILIIMLIMLLSAASVTNLYTRANSHHPGVSAYATGSGLALLVPLSIFFAVYVPIGKWGKGGAWAISLVFAVMSAAIQYKIYAPADGSISLEAIAFGAGIPVAECLLAVLEGILINYLGSVAVAKEQAETAKGEAEARRIKADEQVQRDRDEAKRLADEQAKALQAQQQAQFAFDMEAKRLRLELELELERKKVEAKLSKTLSKSLSNPVSKTDRNTPIEQANGQDEQSAMLDIFRQNPKASLRSVGRQLERSPQTIANWLDDLESQKIIHRNGNGVEIKGAHDG